MKLTIPLLCLIICNPVYTSDQGSVYANDVGCCSAIPEKHVFTKIYADNKLSYISYSSEYVPDGLIYDISNLYNSHANINREMLSLPNYRTKTEYMIDLWRPIERKLEGWTPNTHVACAMIIGNHVLSVIRGNHELYHFKKRTYSTPANAETLSNYWVNQNLLPLTTLVSLCGVSNWEPGDVVVLHSLNNSSDNTSRICPETINNILRKHKKLPAQKLAERITLKGFAPHKKFSEIDSQVSDYITENSGCIVIKNKVQ